MLKLLTLFATIATPSLASAQQPIQVMVLGTYHMGNPGRDVHNMTAEDVRSPRRQQELETLAAALAEFRPTKIMIEKETEGPGFSVADYAAFTPATLAESRDERVQIGYRLARKLGHRTVYGIDEKGDDNEPDYFPYGALVTYAEKNGRAEEFRGLSKPITDHIKEFERRQPNESIAQLLTSVNDLDSEIAGIGGYYRFLSYGDGKDQPGAVLNAFWYMRNAKIFAKLINIAQPGDRLLVIYGSGHAYWLNHFAANTPGFAAVSPLPYLEKAAAR